MFCYNKNCLGKEYIVFFVVVCYNYFEKCLTEMKVCDRITNSIQGDKDG